MFGTVPILRKNTCTRCVYLIPGRPKYSASCWVESFFDKIFFYSTLCLEELLFRHFCLIFHLIGGADPPFIFLSLPLPILCYSDFMKSLTTARTSFVRSRKLSRRSTMTRLRWERSYKRLSKGEIGEQAEAVVDQKNLTAIVSIAGIATEVENDRWECHETCSRPWCVG
jgi:hypothetical protein